MSISVQTSLAFNPMLEILLNICKSYFRKKKTLMIIVVLKNIIIKLLDILFGYYKDNKKNELIGRNVNLLVIMFFKMNLFVFFPTQF